jgi:hypothetical protein
MNFPLERIIHLICLVVIFVFGAILVFFLQEGVWAELGKALIVAGVLGVTIEPWLRKAFARDVFRAAFGYNMPEDFKDKVAEIASRRIICTKHILDVRIQELPNDQVRVLTTIERTFENIGNFPVLHKNTFDIDEWGFSEQTQILRCEIRSKIWSRTKIFKPENIIYRHNLSLGAHTPAMVLFPGHTVTNYSESIEIKRNNDHIFIVFQTPTRNPEIRIIEKPDTLGAEADFGGGKPKATQTPDRWELDGVYFPPAPMRVRWWPKKAFDSWPPKGKKITE